MNHNNNNGQGVEDGEDDEPSTLRGGAHDRDQQQDHYETSGEDSSYETSSVANIMMDDDEEEFDEDEGTMFHRAMDRQEESRNQTAMYLSDQERLWALEIKQAVAERSSQDDFNYLIPLTDFEYAHHAVLARGNVAEALERIQGLQRFRQEYHVNNSVDQAMYYLDQYVHHLQPGAFLNLDICPETGEGIVALDLGAIRPSVAMECPSPVTVNSIADVDKNWKIHIISYYYARATVQPNFTSIREGAYVLMDGQQMGWHNVSMSYETRLHDELWAYYPMKTKKLMVYNTNYVITLFWSLMKPLLNPELRNSIELGCHLEDNNTATTATMPMTTTNDAASSMSSSSASIVASSGADDNHHHTSSTSAASTTPAASSCNDVSLKDLYLQPTLEEASHYMLKRARKLLTLRARNMENFRL